MFLFGVFRTYSSTQNILRKMGESAKNKSARREIQIALQSRLPELRKALGLSQEEFAELIGKSRQGVSLFERGERFITWETCLAIITIAVNRDENILMDLYGEEFKAKFQSIVKN